MESEAHRSPSQCSRALELFLYFFKIGFYTFGGGWSIVAQIQQEYVQKKGWITDEDLLDITSVGRSLPGLMIGNVSYLFGYHVAGFPGALACLLGISLPSLIVLTVVTWCYTHVKRKNGTTEAMAKSEIDIFVQIPVQYVDKIECEAHAERVEIRSIECENIELGVKTTNLILENVVGSVEVDCNLDMEIMCDSLNGEIAINQVSATSKIHIPEKVVFQAVAKGIGTSISYEKAGQRAERFDTPEADNVIELNGIKSELIICIKNAETW